MKQFRRTTGRSAPWYLRLKRKVLPYLIVAVILAVVISLPFLIILGVILAVLLEPISKALGFKNPMQMTFYDSKES